MGTFLDIVGSIVTIALFMGWKSLHWHNVKEQAKKGKRR